MKEYVCHYPFAQSRWGLTVFANDEAEAAERLRAIGNHGKVDGELMATIPANVPGAVLIARLIVWLKNL